jgi:hypothetical protein
MVRQIGSSCFAAVVLKRKHPAAIRPLGVTGKLPVISERMDAIQTIKTMAGSPDAEFSISVPPSCAWFLFLGHAFF